MPWRLGSPRVRRHRVPLTVEPHQLNDPVGGKWLSSLSAYSACQRQRYQRFDLVAERGW